MAATVIVNVDVQDAAALAQLTELDRRIDDLNKKSVTINVNPGTGGGIEGATEDARNLGQTVDETGKKANLGLGRILKWGTAIGAAFAIRSVKSALDTMKDVDQELANIQKVTGQSAEAIEDLGNRAYDAASRYGVSAKDFLANAADFAKAGYDNYEQLAELAIETQLVGDVSADMAGKFLLAADAAYKFGGNTKKLHVLLDEANEIENNFATSIYKIAQGFPIVANTAALANMSVEELMAALGTITAKTQQTGSKAATALRALIMNINHEVGEWIDDGEEKIQVTEESVKSLTDALSKYGNEAVQAALATGEIVNPIEAIRSLATAWKNGDLSQRELGGILEKLGGKLRADQLTALIENFDTFESMLDMVGTSAGSADKELDVMLGTWESKVNQLSNTWTAFVSNVADTGVIKGAIEEITGFIGMIDDALTKIKEPGYETAGKKQAETEKEYADLWGQGGELREELDALRANYSSLTEFDKRRLEYLTAQEAAMSGQVEAAKNLTKEEKVKWLNEKTFGDVVLNEDTWTYEQEFVSRALKNLHDFNREYNEAVVEDGSKNKRQIATALQETLNEYSDFYGMIKELRDEGVDVGKDAEDFAKAYESAMARAKQATREAAEEEERFGEISLKERFDYFRGDDTELEELARMEAEESASEAFEEPIEVDAPVDLTYDIRGDDIELEELARMEAEENASGALEEPIEVDVPVQITYDPSGKSFIEQDALIDEIGQKLQEVSDEAGETELEVTFEGLDESQEDIDELISTIDGIPGITEVEFDGNALTVKGEVDSLDAAIRALPDHKTITITIITEGSVPDITPHAKGTKNAPGGLSLVNELGPELISDNGRAYIANGGKPAIINLGKGAIVLTAEETRKALGNATVNNGINAYASGLFNQTTSGKTSQILITLPAGNQQKFNLGNTVTGQVTISKQKTESDTTPPKGKTNNNNNNGNGGSGGSKKKKKDDDGDSKPSNPWDDKEKALKDELDALEELAEWYHNQKKHEEEQETYQKAIEKVDALRKEYLAAGFDETAKEVTTLANKIFDYEEDIADAKSHAIEDMEDELDILKDQIELAENQGDLQRMLELQNEAQKKIAELLGAYREAGFDDTSPQILELANMGFDYASKSGSTVKDLWKNLIEALQDMQDTQDDANELAEKQLAVDEAREALQNAQNQRTVRVFNPITGQWEWVADSKSIQQAQEKLANAEEALLKEQQSQELDAIKKAMENGGSLGDITIGPGLSALLSGASLEQTNAFASALGVLSGGLGLTADTSAKSIFDSVDSHDNVTQYTFNGVTIDASTAENTTLAELTRMITPLALTTNMPA